MSTTEEHTSTGTRVGGARRWSPARRRGPIWWQAIGTATIAATVVNLLILLAGRAGGASGEIIESGGPHLITASGVIMFTVVPLVLGTVLATLLSLWWPDVLRLAQFVGAGLALLSVAGPLLADTDTATRAALTVMHVVVGVAVVLSLEAIRRRTSTGAH